MICGKLALDIDSISFEALFQYSLVFLIVKKMSLEPSKFSTVQRRTESPDGEQAI